MPLRDDTIRTDLVAAGIAPEVLESAIAIDAVLQNWRRRFAKRELGARAIADLALDIDLAQLDVMMAIRADAREMARQGIRVCAIAPGLFQTPMMEALPEETVAGIAANVPFPARLGDPDEFARLAAHVFANPYLNGEVIRLDGATRLPPR